MTYFTQNSILPPYMAFPRFLLETDINDTARIVYMLLLDRSRISQKNEGWQDNRGAVFVIFPIVDLAQTLHKSVTSVKTALSALEQAGFISRQRQGTGRANRIFVMLPKDGFQTVMQTENRSHDGKIPANLTARKLSTSNNDNSNTDFINNQGESRAVYGEYHNVYLSEQDIGDLQETVPNYRRYIESLSEYMASTGRKYQNHAATIRRWARREADERQKQDYRKEYYQYEEGDSL